MNDKLLRVVLCGLLFFNYLNNAKHIFEPLIAYCRKLNYFPHAFIMYFAILKRRKIEMYKLN